MKKDIERMRDKAELSEPIVTKKKEKPIKGLPGASLPSEPIATAKSSGSLGRFQRPTGSRLAKGEEGPEIKKALFIKKVLTRFIVIAIILLIAGGVYYWWEYLRVPDQPEPEVLISFFETERTETIVMKKGDSLFEELKAKAIKFQERDTFQRILVKMIGAEYYFSFEEVSQFLGINIPNNINLLEEHTLFFYSQEEGNRLGIVAKVAGADENFKINLRYWEKTMKEDLEPIFLGQKLNEPVTEGFQDNTYKNIVISYLNFSDPSLTIDYAVVGNYLIITSSKESMYRVIDRLIP